MLKKNLFIIGLLISLGFFVPTVAHSQEEESKNCIETRFGDEFLCDSASARSFCSRKPLSTETADSLVNPASTFRFYQNAYCDLRRQDEEDIFKAVTDQMSAREPGWTSERVKTLLGKRLEDMVGNEVFEYPLVSKAYENEKIMVKSKKALKRQFKAKEMWANGSLLDAPFDLVVDLNLVEIVLFGSQAKWMNEVYKFPKKQTESSSAPSSSAPTPTSENNPPASGSPGTNLPPTPTGGDGVAGSADQSMCVPIPSENGQPNQPSGDSPVVVTPPGQVPKNCGNGKVDPSEGCDDGNTRAGDGCSSTCLKEPGNTLACMDSQAVTFKPFVPKPAMAKPTGASPQSPGAQTTPPANTIVLAPLAGDSELVCPEGSEPPPPKPPVQSLKYVGPTVGGVLKEFPASNKPDCPNGTSSAEITIAGTKHSRCIPTSACGDFEAARELLFGKDYKNDPEKSILAAAIEAFVCIKVTKENRPESPYPVNEGCVDCHILAMNDILTKMLEKNVAPLENNTQAWGLSNRWGPGFSINLDVVSKMSVNALKRKLDGEKSSLTPAEEAFLVGSQACQDAARKLDPNVKDTTNPATASNQGSDILTQQAELQKKALEECMQKLKSYSTVSTAMNEDQKVHGPISTMLNQMFNSFDRLQALNLQIATGVQFLDKKQCTK